MTPCIAQVSTLSSPFEDDLAAYAAAGWPAVELWLTKLETYLESASVTELRARLAELGLATLSAAGQGGLLHGPRRSNEPAWALLQRRLDMLEALGVGTLVIAADAPGPVRPESYAIAAEALAEAARLAARHGVRLALEFQARSPLCASLDTAMALIAHAGAPGLGVCLDLFHYYAGPSKLEDLGLLDSVNLACVHLSDLSGTPRELASDSDRVFPGEGDFQLGPVLDQLARIGYGGPVVLEVLNPQLWAIPADRVADAAFRSLSRLLGAVAARPVASGDPTS